VGDYSVVGPSAIGMEGYETPRALTIEEIKEYVRLYATTAENAVRKAGFDGVEIHSASGYLLDQFLQTTSNKRTGEYGGLVENRLRFVSEVTESVVKAVGANRVGIRLSPFLKMNGKCTSTIDFRQGNSSSGRVVFPPRVCPNPFLR
jgi:NADPH2 dehydrogenase